MLSYLAHCICFLLVMLVKFTSCFLNITAKEEKGVSPEEEQHLHSCHGNRFRPQHRQRPRISDHRQKRASSTNRAERRAETQTGRGEENIQQCEQNRPDCQNSVSSALWYL